MRFRRTSPRGCALRRTATVRMTNLALAELFENLAVVDTDDVDW